MRVPPRTTGGGHCNVPLQVSSMHNNVTLLVSKNIHMHVGVAWDGEESLRLAEKKVIHRKKPLLLKSSKILSFPPFFTVFTLRISTT